MSKLPLLFFKDKPVYEGDVFGWWTVISLAEKNKHGRRRIKCRCFCGFETIGLVEEVCSGKSKKCRRCSLSNYKYYVDITEYERPKFRDFRYSVKSPKRRGSDNELD